VRYQFKVGIAGGAAGIRETGGGGSFGIGLYGLISVLMGMIDIYGIRYRVATPRSTRI